MKNIEEKSDKQKTQTRKILKKQKLMKHNKDKPKNRERQTR